MKVSPFFDYADWLIVGQFFFFFFYCVNHRAASALTHSRANVAAYRLVTFQLFRETFVTDVALPPHRESRFKDDIVCSALERFPQGGKRPLRNCDPRENVIAGSRPWFDSEQILAMEKLQNSRRMLKISELILKSLIWSLFRFHGGLLLRLGDFHIKDNARRLKWLV